MVISVMKEEALEQNQSTKRFLGKEAIDYTGRQELLGICLRGELEEATTLGCDHSTPCMME